MNTRTGSPLAPERALAWRHRGARIRLAVSRARARGTIRSSAAVTRYAALAALLCACRPALAPEPASVEPAPATGEPSPPTAAAAPIPAAPPPAGPPASASDRPDPPAELAALPADHRLPDAGALDRGFVRDCSSSASGRPCELRLDLDGDGALDRAFQIRERRGKRAGIAIAWARGGVSVIAAGAPSRVLLTDVYEDGAELAWSEVEGDLSGLARWSIAEPTATGFRAVQTEGISAGREYPAPSVTGAGIWLDGGDASEILYWDGAVWRRLVLGF